MSQKLDRRRKAAFYGMWRHVVLWKNVTWQARGGGLCWPFWWRIDRGGIPHYQKSRRKHYVNLQFDCAWYLCTKLHVTSQKNTIFIFTALKFSISKIKTGSSRLNSWTLQNVIYKINTFVGTTKVFIWRLRKVINAARITCNLAKIWTGYLLI
jgi:hypothetical protein